MIKIMRYNNSCNDSDKHGVGGMTGMIYQDCLDLQELERYAAALNARAKRAFAPGRLTAVLLRDRILESGGRCEWCGASLVNDLFELDHVISLSRQGANIPRNLVVACPNCNRRKSQKHPARFAAEIYNETRVKTALVESILKWHHIQPTIQMSLFETESAAAKAQIDMDEDWLAVPPYTWSE